MGSLPRTCRDCGEELVPVAVELVLGHADISCDEDQQTVRWGGTTDYGEGYGTLCYLCSNCGEPLAEWVQASLDRMLGNTRLTLAQAVERLRALRMREEV